MWTCLRLGARYLKSKYTMSKCVTATNTSMRNANTRRNPFKCMDIKGARHKFEIFIVRHFICFRYLKDLKSRVTFDLTVYGRTIFPGENKNIFNDNKNEMKSHTWPDKLCASIFFFFWSCSSRVRAVMSFSQSKCFGCFGNACFVSCHFGLIEIKLRLHFFHHITKHNQCQIKKNPAVDIYIAFVGRLVVGRMRKMMTSISCKWLTELVLAFKSWISVLYFAFHYISPRYAQKSWHIFLSSFPSIYECIYKRYSMPK